MCDFHVSLSSDQRALIENNGSVNTFQRTKEPRCPHGVVFVLLFPMVTDVTVAHMLISTTDWLNVVNLECRLKRTEGNKLRTYKLFKNKFETVAYCTAVMPRTHRAAYAKCRCGVAPIRLETGRYERIPAKEDTVRSVRRKLKMSSMLFLNVCYMMICAKFYLPKRYLLMRILIL
jgi:hypothetical protein